MTNKEIYIVNVFNKEELIERYVHNSLDEATNQMEEIQNARHINPNHRAEIVFEENTSHDMQ